MRNDKERRVVLIGGGGISGHETQWALRTALDEAGVHIVDGLVKDLRDSVKAFNEAGISMRNLSSQFEDTQPFEAETPKTYQNPKGTPNAGGVCLMSQSKRAKKRRKRK